MPALNIPKDDQLGLALLREMPDDALAIAIIELERSPDSVPSIPNFSPEQAQQFKNALQTMYTVRAYADVPLEEFVSDVCEALREESELPASSEPRFRERLSRLLSIDALNVAAKAVLLQREHEHDFCSVRILTDARPIFGDDVSGPPSAIIITHMLKLSYHEGAGGRLREIYISMGSGDMARLRAALDRAEAKATSLRDVLDGRLRFIDPQRKE